MSAQMNHISAVHLGLWLRPLGQEKWREAPRLQFSALQEKHTP